VSALAIGGIAFLVLTLLIYAGLHISTALLLVSFVGIWFIRDNIGAAMRISGIAASDAISDYEFGVIPLFVLMGFLVMVSGVGKESYLLAHRACRRIPGGLGHATVFGNAIFSAITGVTVAALVLFTKLAVPEMIERGYDKRFAVGVVAGSAMLGMLIPPSVLMILYAILTDESIGKLFLAGIVPGLLLTAAFSVAIAWLAIRKPEQYGGRHVLNEREIASAREVVRMAMPIVFLIVVVLGGMYAGFFTATEAGATGATAALALALWRRSLNWSTFWKILVDSGHVTGSLILMIIAANVFSRFLAMSGLPDAMGQRVQSMGLGLYGALGIYILVLLLLGTAMDSASTVLIAVPVFAVIFKAFNADLIWIGIITMITVEVGLITPPLGMAPFVIKMTLDRPDITLDDIYAGALPFALAALAVVGLIVAFPKIATGIL